MRLLYLSIVALVVLMPLTALAQTRLTNDQRTNLKQHLQTLTPEQRAALTDKAADKWQNLSPTQQSAIKNKAKNGYDQMTPEQKQAVRERIRDRRTRTAQ